MIYISCNSWLKMEIELCSSLQDLQSFPMVALQAIVDIYCSALYYSLRLRI